MELKNEKLSDDAFFAERQEVLGQWPTGKDLSTVPHVVGIGGALCNSENPLAVLRHAAGAATQTGRMLPRNPGFMLDERYILSAMGMIGAADPDLALTIMKRELRVLAPTPHDADS